MRSKAFECVFVCKLQLPHTALFVDFFSVLVLRCRQRNSRKRVFWFTLFDGLGAHFALLQFKLVKQLRRVPWILWISAALCLHKCIGNFRIIPWVFRVSKHAFVTLNSSAFFCFQIGFSLGQLKPNARGDRQNHISFRLLHLIFVSISLAFAAPFEHTPFYGSAFMNSFIYLYSSVMYHSKLRNEILFYRPRR